MKAMILAAGFGTRLGALTAETPKCLIEVAGVPMIEYVIKNLLSIGVTSLAVNTHYLSDKVEKYLHTSPLLKDIELKIFHENPILGTGGALKNAMAFLSDGDFIVHNADIYEDFDLQALVNKHKSTGALATLAVVDKQTKSCVLTDSADAYHGLWKEGNVVPDKLNPLTYTGVQCISKRVFQYMLDREGEFPIFPVYDSALKNGEKIMTAYQVNRYFIDIGTPEDLEKLRRKLA